MNDVYYSPEKFGLQTVGEVEFSSGNYEFDLTVVWRDGETGVLYYADDSGCSCPSPFDGIGRDDLTRIDTPQALVAHLDQRKRDSYYYGEEYYGEDTDRIDAECADLIARVARSNG